jgi:hypothetical protein
MRLQGIQDNVAQHASRSGIPRPGLGYYGVIEDPGIHVAELPIVSINIADVVEPYGPRGQNEDAAHREARKQRKSCLPAVVAMIPLTRSSQVSILPRRRSKKGKGKNGER